MKSKVIYYVAYGQGSINKDTSWYHTARFIEHLLNEGTLVKAVWRGEE